jgi:hypothetical protein
MSVVQIPDTPKQTDMQTVTPSSTETPTIKSTIATSDSLETSVKKYLKNLSYDKRQLLFEKLKKEEEEETPQLEKTVKLLQLQITDINKQIHDIKYRFSNCNCSNDIKYIQPLPQNKYIFEQDSEISDDYSSTSSLLSNMWPIFIFIFFVIAIFSSSSRHNRNQPFTIPL